MKTLLLSFGLLFAINSNAQNKFFTSCGKDFVVGLGAINADHDNGPYVTLGISSNWSSRFSGHFRVGFGSTGNNNYGEMSMTSHYHPFSERSLIDIGLGPVVAAIYSSHEKGSIKQAEAERLRSNFQGQIAGSAGISLQLKKEFGLRWSIGLEGRWLRDLDKQDYFLTNANIGYLF